MISLVWNIKQKKKQMNKQNKTHRDKQIGGYQTGRWLKGGQNG